jgi:hypothetical protein
MRMWNLLIAAMHHLVDLLREPIFRGHDIMGRVIPIKEHHQYESGNGIIFASNDAHLHHWDDDAKSRARKFTSIYCQSQLSYINHIYQAPSHDVFMAYDADIRSAIRTFVYGAAAVRHAPRQSHQSPQTLATTSFSDHDDINRSDRLCNEKKGRAACLLPRLPFPLLMMIVNLALPSFNRPPILDMIPP